MLRDDVLLLLTEAEGYLSGEEMREKLGVSRAAVSQAVRALRADGYDIDAVTNRGYCLRARPDTLTAGDVLAYLPEARRATVQCFAEIDSTNSYLKAEAMRGAPDGLCAIADRQTAGRGRSRPAVSFGRRAGGLFVHAPAAGLRAHGGHDRDGARCGGHLPRT